MADGSTWVFGYGSLVSPDSLGATLGRAVTPGVDFLEAVVTGYGRRWNYGVGHTRGVLVDDGGRRIDHTIVALGVVAASGETANGVVARVSDDELARLDHRERHYDRVEITATTEVLGPTRSLDGPVVTYVPRPEAIARYETARDRGLAAIEQRYWDLVDAAFSAFGAVAHRRYHETTPAPDVPVLVLERVSR